MAMAMIKPHLFALVEVGKYSPFLPGYQLTKSVLRNFGGSLLYIRGDMLIIKSESLGDAVVTLIKPNPESIVCVVAIYISPNDDNYANSVNKVEEYLNAIVAAYQNISVVVFGDFNHKADSAFQGYKRNFPQWTFQGRTRTVTDMFLTKSNATNSETPTLEEYSDNATFASADHRLLALRLRIPVNSMRMKVTLPKVTERLKEMENILLQTRLIFLVLILLPFLTTFE